MRNINDSAAKDMSDKPKLLPCPFCGSDAELYESDVWCSNDKCYIQPYIGDAKHNITEAISLWNTRAEDAKTKAMREAIKSIAEVAAMEGADILLPLIIRSSMKVISAHYCEDDNGYPVCPEDPEWAACRCGVKNNV